MRGAAESAAMLCCMADYRETRFRAFGPRIVQRYAQFLIF